MKKLNLSLLILLLSISMIGFTGCKDPEPAHEHTFSDAWSKDATHHWHAATCEHTTEVSGKAAHSFGDWTVTKEATEEAEGSKERTCTVCGYTATESIEKLAHTHKFAEEWTSDASGHWHAATCGHDVTDSKAEHSFGDWTVTKAATKEAKGSKERVCTVCNKEEVVDFAKIPEEFVLVEGETITGTESWTPESSVFVSGRSLTIPNLYVSDHEVTRGEYKAVMGSDPSTASAYNKDGTKLEGDDVVNNPVNYVNWYDAIVYCNKLSIMGSLTPCYSINGETDPDKWGKVPISNDSTWNAAICNFEADGYRLPTEAEWEWFARGGENYKFAGSDNKDDVAWYKTNPRGTRDVKTKDPNGYGLYDMSGNVREWCWDWYVANIDDSIGEYGAASGVERIMRGGSWYDTESPCTVYYRSLHFGPDHLYNDTGFRVVRLAN